MNVKALTLGLTIMTTAAPAPAATAIGRHDIKLTSDLMTPETLWAMGRIGAADAAPDGKRVAYQIGYYSVKLNKSRQVISVVNVKTRATRQLTPDSAPSQTDPQWLDTDHIAYLSGGEIHVMNADGTGGRQVTHTDGSVDAFKFSPDGRSVILIKSAPFHEIIKQNPEDLPLATGRRITDLMYRHWDHYVETISHPWVCPVTAEGVGEGKDLLQGEPFECPMEPFGGIEQLAWSPDSKQIAYTCRKKTGRDYAISTDSDIFLYDVESGTTKNLCKPADYREPDVDPTHTMRDQAVNSLPNLDNNPGYDQNPQFSPDGRYLLWQSMARDGYESDLNRLCLYNTATGEKTYLATAFDSNAEAFSWMPDSKAVAFTGVWHGTINLYLATLDGQYRQLTDDWADYVSVAPANSGQTLLVARQSQSAPSDLYIVTPGKSVAKTKVEQITFENKHITDQLALGKCQQRWVKTTDGKDMLVWIMLPAHFDPAKKYPTLLFCEGGPQSPVSQFWSYRWNFQIMAANGYVIVAPNRRGLPGFGHEWNEAVSSHWTGQCMDDYLSAIDDAAQNLPFVDRDRLGAVGASFGGFSVYWLAGHHSKRFKCFIAHDGAFNLESMYTDTEEAWFSNWEYDDAYWNRHLTPEARRTYDYSPHKWVDQWDTPILCIHGEKDYRINANQGFGAFNAARLRGVPAELLLFPDENHWVLKPQNGVLWQRTFFGWLDRWLK